MNLPNLCCWRYHRIEDFGTSLLLCCLIINAQHKISHNMVAVTAAAASCHNNFVRKVSVVRSDTMLHFSINTILKWTIE